MGNLYFSSKVLDRIIQTEHVDSLVYTDSAIEPNWIQLHEELSGKRYNMTIADRNVLIAKMKWYEAFNKRDQWVIARFEKLEQFGADVTTVDGIAEYNGLGWYLFLKSNNVKQLKAAVKLMENAVNSDLSKEFIHKPHWDTYANLLYKVGRVQDAIRWEEKAIEAMENEKDLGTVKENLDEYRAVVDKMRRGEPTYVEKGAIWSTATMPKKVR